jgi:hypothetical protein
MQKRVIKNGVDSFAAAHAATHMGQSVRTSSVAAPHHQKVSPNGGKKGRESLLCQIGSEFPSYARSENCQADATDGH